METPTENPPAAEVVTPDDAGVEVEVSSVATEKPLSSRLKKAGSKRKLSISFNDKPDVEVFEIEDGHNFRKTPSQAKQKAMAGRWSNPMSLSSGKKRIRVDEMEDIEQEKKKDNPEPAGEAVKEQEAAPAEKETPKPASGTPSKSKEEVAKMTDQQVEEGFMAAARASFLRLVESGAMLKVNAMVPALKASGLFDRIKTKHGAVRKWFTSKPDVWGLSSENYISLKEHDEEFRKAMRKILVAAPKNMLRFHQLTTELKARFSENGYKRHLKGYPSLEAYIGARPRDFLVSKKGGFVTIKPSKYD